MLAPMAAVLADDPEVALTTALHPLSSPAFERAGVAGLPLSTWFDRLPASESDLRRWLEALGTTHLVCSLSSRFRDLTNCRLITAAHTAGIPTLGFLDSWVGFDRFVDDAGRTRYLPDVAGCIDDYCRQRLIRLGMAPAAVHVVGHPRLEAAVGRAPLAPRQGEIRVLLVSQPRASDRSFVGIFESSVGGERLLDRLAAACVSLEVDERLRMTCRAHPKEVARLSSFPSPITRDARAATEPVYRDQDILIGVNSTVLVEAALAGRVVICLRVPELADAVEEPGQPFPLGLEVRDLGSLASTLREAVRLTRLGLPPPGQQLPDVSGSLERVVALTRDFLVTAAPVGEAEV